MDQRVKVWLGRGETRSVQIGRGVWQGCCLSPNLFNLYSECLTKEVLDGIGDFTIREQIIQIVKYADDLVLMAKVEAVLQGMIQFNSFRFPKNLLQGVNHMDIEVVRQYIYIYKVIQIIVEYSVSQLGWNIYTKKCILKKLHCSQR